MTASIAPKQARIQLEKQIELLGLLRNAGTRAQEFREWRQTTLTLIERIWPDQPSRATRFRRIPFSPTSAKAEDKLTREAFERGCAEARRLLRLWLAEISSRGVTQEAEAPRLAEAVRATLVEMQPPIDLDDTDTAEIEGPPEHLTGPEPERLGRPAPPARPSVPGRPAAGRPPVQGGKPAPGRPGKMRKRRQQGDGAKPEVPAEFEMTRNVEPSSSDALADALAQSIDQALERARRESRGMRPSGDPIDSRGRTHDPAAGMQQRVLVSYIARAFIGMAGDVEELGVPEGHRERVRLALLDLAHHLDTGSVTWALMRDAVTLVMHYPALGRQALPLLLPYLENAA
jgi:hypothetical protein